MKDAISPISVMHIYAYAMMVVPIIVLNRNRIYEKKIYVIIKIILYILILLSIFIPIFIEGFGYASPGLFAVWVISTICIMVVYWIAFFLVQKNFLNVYVLDAICSVFFCVSGILIGESPPLHCYWVLVILSTFLFVLSVIQLIIYRIRR